MKNKNQDKIVTLKTFMNEIDAEVTVSHLKSNDIDAFVSRDDSGSMDPFLQLTNGVRVMIRESDKAKALEVLEAMDI